MSNPLKSIGKAVKKVFKGIGKVVKKVLPVLAVAAVAAVAIYTGGVALGVIGQSGVATAGVGASTGAIATQGVPTLLSQAAMNPAGSTAILGSAAGPTTAAGISALGSSSVAAAGGVLPGAAPSALSVAQAGNTVSLIDAAVQGKGVSELTGISASATANAFPGTSVGNLAQETSQMASTVSSGSEHFFMQNPSAPLASGATEAPASAASGLWAGVKKAAGGVTGFVKENPMLSYLGFQAAAAALREPVDPNPPPKALFGVSPEGKIPYNNEMYDYINSPYASDDYKKMQQPVSPTQVAATQAPVMTTQERSPLGLIDPGEPIKLNTVGQAPTTLAGGNVRQNLPGGVKITGTA